MSRARRSGLDDLIAVAAKLPWWVALLLAVISYAVLHTLASVVVEKPVGLGGLGGFAGRELLRVLVSFFQYILPVGFVIGAVVSAISRFRRRTLLSEMGVAGRALDSLDWREFEMLVGEAFRQQGFQVGGTAAGADGGVDLELRKGTELHLVQCKQWRAQKVGVAVVRELYGVMAARGAAGGFVVASGTYTKDAESFAAGRNIVLIGGDRLSSMVEAARASMSRHSGSGTTESRFRQAQAKPVSDAMAEKIRATGIPACPICGSAMVRRVARRGTNAGNAFWGCAAFPRCKGTLPIA
ncbi:MAG: restriction endonuclease [Desulfobacterales bacterium]|jgi:restriction system protein|nr:restriction endonuclease [Desulfobacterales bacterium]